MKPDEGRGRVHCTVTPPHTHLMRAEAQRERVPQDYGGGPEDDSLRNDLVQDRLKHAGGTRNGRRGGARHALASFQYAQPRVATYGSLVCCWQTTCVLCIWLLARKTWVAPPQKAGQRIYLRPGAAAKPSPWNEVCGSTPIRSRNPRTRQVISHVAPSPFRRRRSI